MAIPSEEVAKVFANLGDLEKQFADVELAARTISTHY
jgi:hypothetical protein